MEGQLATALGADGRSDGRLGRDLCRELVEQRFCVSQVERVEALGEPAVDGREGIAGLGAPALVAAKPGEARSGAQFPELGLLLSGNGQSPMIQFLGGLGTALPQEQLAFVAVQLRLEILLTARR